MLSENTFAGHWETVVDCIEWKTLRNVSNDKFYQRIASEHNCDSIRTYGAVFQKVQQPTRMDKNGQPSAVLQYMHL